MGVLARKGDCNMNKLFFFDIDGTLIDCNQDIYEITPETIRTLDKLKDMMCSYQQVDVNVLLWMVL